MWNFRAHERQRVAGRGGGGKRDRETKNHYSMTIDCRNGMPKTRITLKIINEMINTL